MEFKLLARDSSTRARLGRIVTDHGEIHTPVFMPVGTAGTVKAITQDQLEELGAEVILGNTYHLYLRPGHELIGRLGGLHRFMSWKRPLLTDSGGFQVFSQSRLRTIEEEGVSFRSHLDGSAHFLSPEKSVEIQRVLGADIMMAFDECPAYPLEAKAARESMERTLRWARRSKHTAGLRREDSHPHGQWLFGIGQGGTHLGLRRECIRRLVEMDFPGFALGGLSVGEPRGAMLEAVEQSSEDLPEDRPRYLMGVGTPRDLVECVALGVDMFDCVLPTRNGRNGWLFTRGGHLAIKHARYAADERPVDEGCGCMVCRRYSRAYLRHLFQSNEVLAAMLNTYHNLYFYLDTMREIRDAIASFRLREYLLERVDREEAG